MIKNIFTYLLLFSLSAFSLDDERIVPSSPAEDWQPTVEFSDDCGATYALANFLALSEIEHNIYDIAHLHYLRKPTASTKNLEDYARVFAVTHGLSVLSRFNPVLARLWGIGLFSYSLTLPNFGGELFRTALFVALAKIPDLVHTPSLYSSAFKWAIATAPLVALWGLDSYAAKQRWLDPKLVMINGNLISGVESNLIAMKIVNEQEIKSTLQEELEKNKPVITFINENGEINYITISGLSLDKDTFTYFKGAEKKTAPVDQLLAQMAKASSIYNLKGPYLLIYWSNQEKSEDTKELNRKTHEGLKKIHSSRLDDLRSLSPEM